MAWWGKTLGGAFGFMMGGPLGAMIGIAFGHNFDKGLKSVMGGEGFHIGDQQRVQAAFFTTTFSVMGHLAKADGSVSKEEIRMAQAVMDQMGLTGDAKESAKKLFNEGKSENFPLDDILLQFKKEAHRRSTIIRAFIEIQTQAAYADGVMDVAEHRLLLHICDVLGFSKADFEQIEEMVKVGFSGAGQSGTSRNSSSLTLESAYAMLGVDETTSMKDVKKAYRRLMSQHHPDKLVAKGLPEEMIKDATAKTQKIKEAYEFIKQHG
ncbi:MAG: co-chaperone DjlA [Gammaproteobacteria bacterium]|nr:co-chaperone DjlA [Gammaproteobacteria bacterium]